MSAGSPSPTAPSLRRLPFTVRLSPSFVNRLLSGARRVDSAHDNISGLLFGAFEETLLLVQAFRPFEESEERISGKESPARRDQLLERLLTAARQDAETSPLELVGWYAVRANGGLLGSDIQFHDLHFKRPGDLALVLRPDGSADVVVELYCRSANGVLSDEAHRWGVVRLTQGAPLVGSMEVTMRAKIQDDFFMQAYQATDSEEEEAGDRGWKNGASSTAKRMFGFFGSGRKEKAPALKEAPPAAASRQLLPGARPSSEVPVPTPEPKPLGDFPGRSTGLVHVGAQLPQRVPAGSPGVPALPKRRGVPWIAATAVFAVAAILTFGLVYTGGRFSADNLPALPGNLFSAPKLGLRLESQGDRILLSWNRQHPAVRRAKNAVLQIDDGAQHRQVNLDAAQVSNGSVLYRPVSDDITFRLEVEGAGGEKVAESMRVLEEAKPSTLDLSGPDPRSSVSRAVEPTRPPDSKARNEFIKQAPSAAAQKPATVIFPKVERAAPEQKGTASPPPARNGKAQSSLPAQLPTIRNKENEDAPKSEVAFDVLPPTPAKAAPVQAAKSEPASLTTTGSAAAATGQKTETAQNAPPLGSNASALPAPGSTPPVRSPIPAARTPGSALESYHAPHPLRQVLPSLSALPPAVLVGAGRVEVVVKVDERGRVVEAHLVEGARKVPSSLANASLLAARQWTFAPATLGGKVVPSQHSIVFQFRPPQ